MKLELAINMYLMESRINQTQGNVTLKEGRLSYFNKWCMGQGFVDLGDILKPVVTGFIVHLQGLKAQEINPNRPTQNRPLAPLTIKGYFRIIRAFFAWCKREGLLAGAEDPTTNVPRLRIPKRIIQTFTPQQLATMLDSCDFGKWIGHRDYALLLVLIDTGIRVSELCGLTIDAVNEQYITVYGKNSKEREVGIGPTASLALHKYIHMYRPQQFGVEQHVFLTAQAQRMTRNTVEQLLKRLALRTGITGVRLSAHTFRHTFARSWLENGGEIFKLSRVLGHTDIQTTEVYLRDFQSRDARIEHILYSPVEKLKLGKSQKKGSSPKSSK